MAGVGLFFLLLKKKIIEEKLLNVIISLCISGIIESFGRFFFPARLSRLRFIHPFIPTLPVMFPGSSDILCPGSAYRWWSSRPAVYWRQRWRWTTFDHMICWCLPSWNGRQHRRSVTGWSAREIYILCPFYFTLSWHVFLRSEVVALRIRQRILTGSAYFWPQTLSTWQWFCLETKSPSWEGKSRLWLNIPNLISAGF